jgi:hypothetical protein
MKLWRLEDPDFLRRSVLYDLTGNILDVNTLLVNRNEFKSLQPWYVRLQICWTNWLRVRRFVLNCEKGAFK